MNDRVKYIDIKSLMDFNKYTQKDFIGKEYLRGRCPDCPSGKSPALSIHKSLKYAKCFRCDSIFINLGMHHEEIMDILLNTEAEESSLCGIKKCPDPMVELFYDKVSPSGTEYLRNRNPFVQDWTKYNLGYDDKSIFIPYYYMGRMIFYQIRYMEGERRYNMPSLPSPIYLPHEWNIFLPTIICEGPFDAIALDCSVGDKFNIIGLVGKELTAYKCQLISHLSTPKYYIMLDEEVLSNRLRYRNRLLSDATIIPTSGPDPEEVLLTLGMDGFRDYIDKWSD